MLIIRPEPRSTMCGVGVIGLTKALARELAPRGVLVNAIAPGPIEAPLVDGLSNEWKQAKEAELPLRRFGGGRGRAECGAAGQ